MIIPLLNIMVKEELIGLNFYDGLINLPIF